MPPSQLYARPTAVGARLLSTLQVATMGLGQFDDPLRRAPLGMARETARGRRMVGEGTRPREISESRAARRPAIEGQPSSGSSLPNGGKEAICLSDVRRELSRR